MNCRSLTETDGDVSEAECMAEAVKPRRAKAKASRTKGKVRMLSLVREPSAPRAEQPWGRAAVRATWPPPSPDLPGLLSSAHFFDFPHQSLFLLSPVFDMGAFPAPGNARRRDFLRLGGMVCGSQ